MVQMAVKNENRIAMPSGKRSVPFVNSPHATDDGTNFGVFFTAIGTPMMMTRRQETWRNVPAELMRPIKRVGRAAMMLQQTVSTLARTVE
jgi:hypothetical protein